jgi:hypothetical protein
MWLCRLATDNNPVVRGVALVWTASLIENGSAIRAVSRMRSRAGLLLSIESNEIAKVPREPVWRTRLLPPA